MVLTEHETAWGGATGRAWFWWLTLIFFCSNHVRTAQFCPQSVVGRDNMEHLWWGGTTRGGRGLRILHMRRAHGVSARSRSVTGAGSAGGPPPPPTHTAAAELHRVRVGGGQGKGPGGLVWGTPGWVTGGPQAGLCFSTWSAQIALRGGTLASSPLLWTGGQHQGRRELRVRSSRTEPELHR